MHSSLLPSGHILAVLPDFFPEAAIPAEGSLYQLPALHGIPDRLCQLCQLRRVQVSHSARLTSPPSTPHLQNEKPERRYPSAIENSDGFSGCTQLTCSCGLCGYLGRNPGEELNWGGIPGRSDKSTPSLNVLVQSAKSGCKWGVENPLSFLSQRSSSRNSGFPAGLFIVPFPASQIRKDYGIFVIAIC